MIRPIVVYVPLVMQNTAKKRAWLFEWTRRRILMMRRKVKRIDRLVEGTSRVRKKGFK